MRRRSFLMSTAAAGGCAVVAARATAAAQRGAEDAPLPVVASFSVLGDMVRQVGGARVAVRCSAGPGQEAHGPEAHDRDADELRAARLAVRNGLGFDPWFDRALQWCGYLGPTVTATDGIEPRGMEGERHSHGHDGVTRRRQHFVPPHRVADPHCWQDLRLGRVYIQAISAGLALADRAGAGFYGDNAAAYIRQLARLDAWVRAQIETVPPARRRVITSDDSLGYFGDAYGIEFLPANGVVADAPSSGTHWDALAHQIRAERVTAVFLADPDGDTVPRGLAEEAGVPVAGRLYADTLSQPDGPAPTYTAMFRHNVGLLVPAMQANP